ncbi:hypothetical protein [Lactococcus lactis]|uniref:Uncharacterized protein n=1 Tax=Lactococcus lactis subsp. lactis TaxID=1360 RepID=A0A2N5W9P5_LACLL|nr:hypothetical protein [Lactococcus lactis]PLW58956.1 hypothetical protein CYU10_002345 [Lactococcus lactis subsp. lactis]
MKANVKEMITSLYRALKNHIGSGGSAHSVATATTNGFLSAEDKVKYDGASGDLVYIEPGIDVLTLPSGKYQGYSLVNTPLSDTNSTIVNIEVYQGTRPTNDLKRKFFIFTTTVDGRKWTRAIHQNGHDTGWMDLEQSLLLFQGAFSEGNLTLPKSLSEFRKLKVEYTESNAGYRIAEFYIRSEFNLEVTNVGNESGTALAEMAECRVTLLDSKLTIAHNRKISMNFAVSPAGGGDIIESKAITISKIWGIL